ELNPPLLPRDKTGAGSQQEGPCSRCELQVAGTFRAFGCQPDLVEGLAASRQPVGGQPTIEYRPTEEIARADICVERAKREVRAGREVAAVRDQADIPPAAGAHEG